MGDNTYVKYPDSLTASADDVFTIGDIELTTMNGIDSYIIGNTDLNYDWNTTLSTSMAPDTLNVKGNANFEGDIIIQGKSLGDTLASIESRLAILHPNIELEEKWENLRGLRQAYVELEREIIEKEKMWAILNR